MKASDLQTALDHLLNTKQPVFIWGAPGVGKSQIVKQTAEKHDLKFQDERVIHLEPVDLRGFPVSDGKTAKWIPFDFLPTEGEGILFLDEMNAAPPSIQAACYQLVLDRRLGDYELPEGWVVWAAGNRQTDRAVVHHMPSALANRFIHLDLDADLDDWISWAIKSEIKTEIMAFLRFRPELLHKFDPKTDTRAFPTPRSWEMVDKALPVPNSIEFSMVSGIVGEGAGSEFLGFLKIFRQLPDPISILMDPMSHDIPEDPATLYAIAGSLANAVTETTMDNLVSYLERIPPEFSVICVKDAVKRDYDLHNTRAFIKWAGNNKDLII